MVYSVKDAIEGKKHAHRFFTRFGKGEFKDRFVLRINKKANKIKVGGSFENVPGLIIFLSGLTDAKYKGKILAKKEIGGLIKAIGLRIIDKKIRKLIEYEVIGDVKKGHMKKIYPEIYYLLLDANAEGIEFKCKKRLPKPSKKSEVKADDKFFSLIVDEKYFDNFKREFLFDVPESKKIKIRHDIIVEDIIIPGELEKSNDYEKIRLEALRKGKILRKIKANGKEIIKEYKFII